MNGVISKYYPPYINLVFRVYYLSAKNEKSFKAKRILWFSMLLFFNCFELVKSIFNGIVDSNLLRYYLVDLICTLNSNQIIFDFSFAVTYVYIIRLGLRLLLGRANRKVFNAKYLKFLEADTERALIEQHSFTAKDARIYFKLIKFMAWFIRYNVAVYLGGVALGIIRVFILASHVLDLRDILIFSLPNAFSLGFTYALNYSVTCTFYGLFWLDCVFMNRKLNSLVHKTALLQQDSCLIHKRFESSLRTNLNHLNQILEQFHHRQTDYNFTVAQHFVGVSLVGFTFPFIFLFNGDDWISFLFCTTLYLQGLLFSFYSIIGTSVYLDRGFVKYRKFLYKLIVKTQNVGLKLKMENFLSFHNEGDAFMGYGYIQIFDYSHAWMLTFFLESFSIIILLCSGFIIL